MPKRKALPALTELDLAILQGVADGKIISELAAELGLSSWALRYRVTRIKTVIPSKNYVNLIAEAIRKGHID
jgi:DNA-binding CsgD family transcriptional regulator